MNISPEQKEYYKNKLNSLLVQHYKYGVEKFDQKVNDCFRYLEIVKDEQYKNVNERKKILVNFLIKLPPEIQLFYFKLESKNQNYTYKDNSDFYGVRAVFCNIIQNYNFNDLYEILKDKEDISKLKNLKTLSETLLENISLLTLDKLFNNYFLDKNYIINISETLAENLISVLDNKSDFSFIDTDINNMKKFNIFLNEKIQLCNITSSFSNYLQSNSKKENNKILLKIEKLESNLLENYRNFNFNEFLDTYVKEINNLRINSLNNIYSIDIDKQHKFNEQINYLKNPIKINYEINILSFLKNRFSALKSKKNKSLLN